MQKPEPTTAYLENHQGRYPIPELPGADTRAYTTAIYLIPWLAFSQQNEIFDEMTRAAQLQDRLGKEQRSPNAEEQALMVRAAEQRKQLVASCLGIAVTNAYSRNSSDLDLDDLIQAASLTAHKASGGFAKVPPDQRNAYIPYLQSALKRGLSQEVNAQLYGHRLDTRVYYDLDEFRKVQIELYEERGRLPSIPEIAEKMQINNDRAFQIFHFARPPILLPPQDWHRLSEKTGLEESYNYISPEAQADQERKTILMERALLLLPPGQAKIVYMRYAFDGGEALDYAEIAKKLGLEELSVRRFLLKASNKIKTLWPQLEAGTFDYIKWRQKTKYGRNVLTFLAMAGIPIPEQRLIDVRVAARQYLRESQEKQKCTARECAILTDVYGLNDAGTTLGRGEAREKWKLDGRNGLPDIERKVLPYYAMQAK